jgi:hypothetical protein
LTNSNLDDLSQSPPDPGSKKKLLRHETYGSKGSKGSQGSRMLDEVPIATLDHMLGKKRTAHTIFSLNEKQAGSKLKENQY